MSVLSKKRALLRALAEKQRRNIIGQVDNVVKVFSPQPGGQQQFFDTTANICIYGGQAGGGKTSSLVGLPTERIDDPFYTCVIFRRVSPQITNPGGLKDESMRMYPKLGGTYNSTHLEWQFPSGAKIKMAHMQYEHNKYDWQGSQITDIFFDELTHFEEEQFFYMLGRNRSMSAHSPRIRATCNPDANSWLAKFLSWWIDPETGLAIPERSGVLRWFVRYEDTVTWADTREELINKFSTINADVDPKSVTFIIGKLEENKALLANNPGYVGNLDALPYVERARLKDGNWKVRATGGTIFQLHWWKRYSRLPKDRINDWVRYWDLGGSNSPTADFSVGLLMGMDKINTHFYIPDVKRGQWSPKERDEFFLYCLIADNDLYGNVRTVIEWVPGIAQEVIDGMVKLGLSRGFSVETDMPKGKKYSRAQPVSKACEAGLVYIPENAPWVEPFTTECINFSENEKDYWKDDQVDAKSGAFKMLTGEQPTGFNIIKY